MDRLFCIRSHCRFDDYELNSQIQMDKFDWRNNFCDLWLSHWRFPVMLLNGIIVLVDIYYLRKIYATKQLFDTVEIRPDSQYLQKFLDFHKEEIHEFFPDFVYNAEKNTVSFFILRNTTVAGLFLAHRENGDVLKVGLDYVIPEYRDYKNGKYVYTFLKDDFKNKAYKKVMAETSNPKHTNYLKKLGFKKNSQGLLVKEF